MYWCVLFEGIDVCFVLVLSVVDVVVYLYNVVCGIYWMDEYGNVWVWVVLCFLLLVGDDVV